MATKKKTEYVSHTSPKEISTTSRCAVKIRDNFYTIEASETKTINSTDGLNMDFEWKALFDEVNTIVDNQCEEIINSFDNKK